MKYLNTLQAYSSEEGLKGRPKFICKDKVIGTSKAKNMEVLQPMKCYQGK